MPWNSWPLFARFKPAPEAYAIACDWKEVTAALYTVRETRSEFSSSSFPPIPPSSFTRCATMLHTSDLFLGPPYRHDACRIINITTGVALVNETRQDNSLAINIYIYFCSESHRRRAFEKRIFSEFYWKKIETGKKKRFREGRLIDGSGAIDSDAVTGKTG